MGTRLQMNFEIGNIFEQSLKEIGKVNYAVAKKAKPATAEVVFNKQLYDILLKIENKENKVN